jgi:hypothetical protein
VIRGRRPFPAVALVMVAAALIGCGRRSEGRAGSGDSPAGSVVSSGPRQPCARETHAGAEQTPDTPVSSSIACPAPTEPPGPPHRRIVEPQDGQVDLRPIAWTRARVARDDRTVTIDFASGIAPCSVLDHVDVEDRPDAVIITLFEGHAPGAGNVACIEIAQLKAVRILLDRPVSHRELVDGAAS